MSPAISKRIRTLLDAIKDDFPRRQRIIEASWKRAGLEPRYDLKVEAPEMVSQLPTFHAQTSRNVTPMLKARFEYAGAWRMGIEIWLSASKIATRQRNRSVRGYHRALRENWDDSAPMLFPDERLSLFGITENVPDSLTYLVWPENNNSSEPEIWSYSGFECGKYDNLELFLIRELNFGSC